MNKRAWFGKRVWGGAEQPPRRVKAKCTCQQRTLTIVMSTREPLLHDIEPDDLERTPSKPHRPPLAATQSDAESGKRPLTALFPD